DILNGIRIKAAKGLLFDPTLKISDICDMVGYTDTAHFSRVFKKLEGMSANEYRNTMCKEK
nr:helix-turn-helix transcriptional regulator [Clostridia bacterium]